MSKQWINGLVLLAFAAGFHSVLADDTPPSPVGYTEVQEYRLAPRFELPGTVDAPRVSLVASEVEGRVAKLLVREGQHVSKGATLVELENSHLKLDRDRAEADLRETEARLALAKSNFERSTKLFEEGVLSRQQTDDARFEFEAWEGRAARLSAEIARIELDLERSFVKSPFAGVIAEEMTEQGQWIGKGDTVVELMSPYSLEVIVEVPERYYHRVSRGTPATVIFESLPGLQIEGKVASIVPRAKGQSRTFPIRIRIANKDGRIGAGMVTRVLLTAGEGNSARMVPKDSVVTRGSERFVFVIQDDQTAQLVPVTTGERKGDWVSIEGSLSSGDKVITRGNERLRPGQRVVATLQDYPSP